VYVVPPVKVNAEFEETMLVIFNVESPKFFVFKDKVESCPNLTEPKSNEEGEILICGDDKTFPIIKLKSLFPAELPVLKT